MWYSEVFAFTVKFWRSCMNHRLQRHSQWVAQKMPQVSPIITSRSDRTRVAYVNQPSPAQPNRIMSRDSVAHSWLGAVVHGWHYGVRRQFDRVHFALTQVPSIVFFLFKIICCSARHRSKSSISNISPLSATLRFACFKPCLRRSDICLASWIVSERNLSAASDINLIILRSCAIIPLFCM